MTDKARYVCEIDKLYTQYLNLATKRNKSDTKDVLEIVNQIRSGNKFCCDYIRRNYEDIKVIPNKDLELCICISDLTQDTLNFQMCSNILITRLGFEKINSTIRGIIHMHFFYALSLN